MKGILYLLPNSLGHPDHRTFLPPEAASLLPGLGHYIVENLRNARRYLKSIDPGIDIDSTMFYELNKHTPPEEIRDFIRPLLGGHHTGLLSEAGLPGIADPGAQVVKLAHEHGIVVKPFTGPSSIYLAMMASGLNGQSFRFVGYLPVRKAERIRAIRQLESRAGQEGESQIFIETPYRNMALLDDLLGSCSRGTLLTIAVDLTMDSELIRTLKIAEWKKAKPELHKRPAVFIIGS